MKRINEQTLRRLIKAALREESLRKPGKINESFSMAELVDALEVGYEDALDFAEAADDGKIRYLLDIGDVDTLNAMYDKWYEMVMADDPQD